MLSEIIRVDELPWVKVDVSISKDDIEEAIRGAFVCIYSRAFEDKRTDCSKLIPLLDMTQHSEIANIDHESDAEGNVIVTALCDLDGGQELTNTYLNVGRGRGEMEPEKFSIYYGFIPGELKTLHELIDERSPVFFS